MERVLVTGGLGFIGSNFILTRLSDFPESNIVNADSMSYGSNPQNLTDAETNARYRFLRCDIRNQEEIEELVSKSDIVVNFAAETHVDRSIARPSAFLESNVIGTHTLLEASRKQNIRKFVQISTDEVYGSAVDGQSFDENAIMNPSSPYAASKAAADMFAVAYHKTYGLPVLVVRCTNNFGPRQSLEKFIPKTIIRSLLDRKVPVYGDGSQVRDWIYVEDFCSAINLVIERGSIGSIYNVSAGNEISNLDVVKRILEILGKQSDLISFVEDRPGHDTRYSLNSRKIREQLSWEPRLKFDDRLSATVKWYAANESWWKPGVNERILSSTPWKENW